MAWRLDGIRIFTQDNTSGAKAIIARLQPLSGGTTLQVFGYENPIIKLSAIVIGTDDRDALENLTKTGNDYTLVTPYGSDSFYVASFNSKQRLGIISQSILVDNSHSCYDPVYDVEVELFA
jgi:hypothetical protein